MEEVEQGLNETTVWIPTVAAQPKLQRPTIILITNDPYKKILQMLEKNMDLQPIFCFLMNPFEDFQHLWMLRMDTFSIPGHTSQDATHP